MIVCPRCSAGIPKGMDSCPACGARLDDSTSAPTRTSVDSETEFLPSDPSRDRTRFLPGAVLAGRYRIVSLLGRGGMGEVYRADDLKLGQTVALKFLPPGLQRDANRLERFHNEVRLALKVTHPNVCRVYDIGEVDGQHYIAMEYVDGENLASLLRRIGRLPQDGAVRIARQICAGLAAAHDKGILHRDLKPANVMIDGRGNARITDFGVAGVAETIRPADVRDGTPAYMAPEQLEGREVTLRSDVYALGLVLYELFTGKRAYEFDSRSGLRRRQGEAPPSNPSDLVKGLDPSVDPVILRCLEIDPLRRPPTALAVAASLPGGDPLAAALQAGETPAPELVAAAGEEGRLTRTIGVLCILGLVAGLVGLLLLGERTSLLHYAPIREHPEVLVSRAQKIIADLDLASERFHTARGFYTAPYVWGHVLESDALDRWEALRHERPTATKFWYRESPAVMVPRSLRQDLISLDMPPRAGQEGVAVFLDMQGRLIGLTVTRRTWPEATGRPVEEVWRQLFEAGGLDLAAFRPAEPLSLPLVACDEYAAWEGEFPEQPEIPMSVEACALAGRPAYFWSYGPWQTPAPAAERNEATTTTQYLIFVAGALVLLVFGGGVIWMVVRNLRLGRGDRRGAWRLALFVGVSYLISVLLSADHLPNPGAEFARIAVFFGDAFLIGGVIWAFYLAVEPFVRRTWPSLLISWNRLLAGDLRDPRVGRDVLVGLVLGTMVSLLVRVEDLMPSWLGLGPHTLRPPDLDEILSVPRAAGDIVDEFYQSALNPMTMLVGLVILRVILRRPWLAVSAMFLWRAWEDLFDEFWHIELTGEALEFGLLMVGLLRFGLLTSIAMSFASGLITTFPISTEFSAWYGSQTIFAMIVVVLLGGYCLLVSVRKGETPLIPARDIPP